MVIIRLIELLLNEKRHSTVYSEREFICQIIDFIQI